MIGVLLSPPPILELRMSICRHGGLLALALLPLLTFAEARAQSPWGRIARALGRTPPMPEHVVLERDVPYGQAGGHPLLLDILRPKQTSPQPRPAIVFVHGGAWSGGKKTDALGRLLPFAASGDYCCVSVEYRLSGEATWPAQIHDCKAAIRWLKANAAKYHIDPEKIGVWGGSAGGHLVSMLGLTGNVKELEGQSGSPGPSSRVACVVDFCGPSDFMAIAKLKADAGRHAFGPVEKLLGGPIAEKQDLARAASPVTYVSKDAPPFLIVHGTADPVVPLSQAERLYQALKHANQQVTFIKVEGGGHGIGGLEVHARVRAFFDRWLRGQNVEVSERPIQAGR
jgi:acetyl esterase/lipase